MMHSLTQSGNSPQTAKEREPEQGSLFSPAEVLAAYLEHPTNWPSRRVRNMQAFTNRFKCFELKQVKVAGLGWERFRWSTKAEQRSQLFAALSTEFPPIILNPLGLVQDGAHRVRAAELRGDELIWAYVPVGEPLPL